MNLRCFVRSVLIGQINQECESYDWFKQSIRFDHTENLACVLTISAPPSVSSGIISKLLAIVNRDGDPTFTLEFLFDRSEVTTLRGPFDARINSIRCTAGLKSLDVVPFYLNGSTDRVVNISGTNDAIVRSVCQVMKILSEEQIIWHQTDSFNPQKHGPYIGCLVDKKLENFNSQEKEIIEKMVGEGIVAIQSVQCGPKCPPLQLAIPLIESSLSEKLLKIQRDHLTKNMLTFNLPVANQQGSSERNDGPQVDAPQSDSVNDVNRNFNAQDGDDGRPSAY